MITNKKFESDYDQPYIEGLPIEKHGVVLKRFVGGEAVTNVPWLVEEHSLDGFEWGYGGSGPADLALNILEYAVQSLGIKRQATTKCQKGSCDARVWDHHQMFKQKFIAGMNPDGGIIYWIDVLMFVLGNIEVVRSPYMPEWMKTRTISCFLPTRFLHRYFERLDGGILRLKKERGGTAVVERELSKSAFRTLVDDALTEEYPDSYIDVSFYNDGDSLDYILSFDSDAQSADVTTNADKKILEDRVSKTVATLMENGKLWTIYKYPAEGAE